VHHLRGNAIPAGPLSDFDEIFCRWWICCLKQNFNIVGLEMWASAKISNFFVKKLTPKDKSPWAIFTKLGAGERVPGPPPRAKISSSCFRKCGLNSVKIVKIRNFFCLHFGIASCTRSNKKLVCCRKEPPRCFVNV